MINNILQIVIEGKKELSLYDFSPLDLNHVPLRRSLINEAPTVDYIIVISGTCKKRRFSQVPRLLAKLILNKEKN